MLFHCMITLEYITVDTLYYTHIYIYIYILSSSYFPTSHSIPCPPQFAFRVGSMVGSYYSSGLGQFFAAEKLAGQARKNEADDIVWTAKEKAKFWGGSKMSLGGLGFFGWEGAEDVRAN